MGAASVLTLVVVRALEAYTQGKNPSDEAVFDFLAVDILYGMPVGAFFGLLAGATAYLALFLYFLRNHESTYERMVPIGAAGAAIFSVIPGIFVAWLGGWEGGTFCVAVAAMTAVCWSISIFTMRSAVHKAEQSLNAFKPEFE